MFQVTDFSKAPEWLKFD